MRKAINPGIDQISNQRHIRLHDSKVFDVQFSHTTRHMIKINFLIAFCTIANLEWCVAPC